MGFLLAGGGGSGVDIDSTAFVADGTWHHLAVTVYLFSPTGGKFYVDGAQVGAFNPTLLPGSLTSSSPLRLGCSSSSYADFFRGILDEVEVFPRALTPPEIQAIFHAGSSGKCKTPATATPTATATATFTATVTFTPTPTATFTPTAPP